MKLLFCSAIIALVGSTFAPAQEAPKSPYADFEQRPIKALSAQQIADLRAGRGMSLALAAELNGFPGPVHVLELAQGLDLTDEQRAAMEQLMARMKAETVPLGEHLIAQEADLDQLFAARTVTPESLTAATDAIGATQASLRQAHLKYHLATVKVLTADQMRRYAELRGYGGPEQHPGHH
jgi:Spy/CpxP family protein refolding chaperone